MRAKRALTAGEYSAALDTDPKEYDRLIRSLTVNVTKFFRNWDTYSLIDSTVVPALWERGEPETRIWSAGCSSGEEAYSIAILMHKQAAERNEHARLDGIRILGTDIDAECLGEAEHAFYADAALGDTPPALRERYFPQIAGMHTMLPEVRRMVGFEWNDLLAYAPPLEDVHLILCRNVIIYFEREAQDALFAAFHRVLAPGGFLVLGKVETLLGEARGLFTPVNARERIFRKL
jgi:chemotaxis protein methyltransferase CheR